MPKYSDLNFNNGEYIQQYQGIPLQQIQETGNVLAERHYGNLARLSQLGILANQMKSQALPGAKSYFDDQIGGIEAGLADIAKNGGENATARINAMATAFQGDQNILKSQARAKEHAERLATAQKIATETGAPAVYDKDYMNKLVNATPDDPIYNQPFQLNVAPFLSPNADFEKIANNIKPDTTFRELTGVDLITFKSNVMKQDGSVDIDKFATYVQDKKIDVKKLKDLEEQLLSAYKNTASYQQQKDYFGVDSDEKAKKQILDYAKLGTFSEAIAHYMQVNPGRQGGKDGGDPTPALSGKVLTPAVILKKIMPQMPSDLDVSNFRRAEAMEANEFLKERGINKSTDPEYKRSISEKYNQYFQLAKEAAGNLPEHDDKFKGSKEGEKFVKEFLDKFYNEELANDYAYTQTKPTNLINDDYLHRQAPNLVYFDGEHKVVRMLNSDGSINKDWQKLTGGKANSFKYSNTSSPYSIRVGNTAEDAAASGLHQITSEDADGNSKVFYVSNPGEIGADPMSSNTNILYNKVIRQPGVFVQDGFGGQSRILVGKQKDNAWEIHKANFIADPKVADVLSKFPTEQQEQVAKQLFDQQQPAIETKLPNGQLIFGTPASRAEQLAKQGITLSYKK